MNIRKRVSRAECEIFHTLKSKCRIFWCLKETIVKRNNSITMQRSFVLKMLHTFVPTAHGLEVFCCVKKIKIPLIEGF